MLKLRRLVWYIASRLFLLLTVISLCVVVFYYAMNAANIHIVLKDGMAKRAQVIMMGENPDILNKFFQTSYLQRDENLQRAILGQSPYSCYTIRGIDHRLTMTYMWCWPWENTARATFTEEIPRIDGRVNPKFSDIAKGLYGESYQSPPRWQGAAYSATLVKENGQWHIRNISVTSLLEDEE